MQTHKIASHLATQFSRLEVARNHRLTYMASSNNTDLIIDTQFA